MSTPLDVFDLDNCDPTTIREIKSLISKFPNVQFKQNGTLLPNATETNHNECHHSHGETPPFITKPTARQFWLPKILGGGSSLSYSHTQRPATSNDLVLDLVVVFILNQIVHIVANSPLLAGTGSISHNNTGTVSSGTGSTGSSEVVQFLTTFRDAAAVFIPIWANWFRIATLLNRYGQRDIIHYFIFALNLLLYVFVGRGIQNYIHVPVDGGFPNCDAFLYSLVAMLSTQFIWYQYIAYNNPKYGQVLKTESINLIVTGILYTAAALSVSLNNIELFLVLDWLGKFSDIFALIRQILIVPLAACCRCTKCSYRNRSVRYVPINAPLTAERLELFIILCLGESIASSDPKGHLSQNETPSTDTETAVFICCIIALVVCIKCLTIDFGEHPKASMGEFRNDVQHFKHALSTSPIRGATWCLIQLPISFGILFTSAALESCLHGGMTYWRRWACATGVFIVTLCSTIAQSLHKGKVGGGRRVRKSTRIGIRCFLCLCFLILPMFPKKDDSDKFDSSDYGFIFAIVFLLVLMLVSDRYVRKIVNKDVHLMVKDNYMEMEDDEETRALNNAEASEEGVGEKNAAARGQRKGQKIEVALVDVKNSVAEISRSERKVNATSKVNAASKLKV